MAKRREFPKKVAAEIVKRALDPKLGIICEGCGMVLGKRKFHIDHTIADALQIDKSRKLTADDGKLLGVECCHEPKTRKVDVPAIAKAKRREARDLGIKKPARKGKQFRKAPKPSKELSRPLPPRRPLYREVSP